MRLTELITLMTNNLGTLQRQKDVFASVGDVTHVLELDNEITETELIIYKLTKEGV